MPGVVVYITAYHSFAVIERQSGNSNPAFKNSYDIREVKPRLGQRDWPLRITYQGSDAKRVALARAEALERNAGLGEIERTDGDLPEELPPPNRQEKDEIDELLMDPELIDE